MTHEMHVTVCSGSASGSSGSPLGQRAAAGDGGRASEGYDPTRKDYHPVDHACWQRGEKSDIIQPFVSIRAY